MVIYVMFYRGKNYNIYDHKKLLGRYYILCVCVWDGGGMNLVVYLLPLPQRFTHT